tara:strand:- start:1861 stop:2202 length:342 start_codon:yes stop_codon:yes gene_type:complete
MSNRLQSTNLHQNSWFIFERLDNWAINPWRRYSLYLIIFLIGFFLGSSLGMINGALSMMDPIGAFFTVLIIELTVSLRRNSVLNKKRSVAFNSIDMVRIGLLYGLFMEGFKLL